MSFSYDPALTGATDKLRFLLRDTDENRVLFSNEELAGTLAMNSDDIQAARLECLISLLGDSSRYIKWTQAQNSVDKSAVLDALKAMIEEVKAIVEASGSSGEVVDFPDAEIDYYGVRLDPKNSI